MRTTRRAARTGRRRSLAGLLTAAIAAGLLTVAPSAAHAAGNSLYLPGGGEWVELGANATLYVDGTITYDDHCEWDGEGGVDDFVYPVTDVYLVPAGSVAMGDQLHDAAGQYPNTIVGTGSGAFLGELLAVTPPTGMLGDGEYDVVYDTCQDGKLSESDEIFSDAVVVDVPDGQLPPVDASIKLLKDKAREEYAAWLKMHIGLTAILKIGDAKSLAACMLAPAVGCLTEILQGIYGPEHLLAKANGRITSQALALVANQAAHYGAIWQDPADPDFDHLPVVEPHGTPDLQLVGRPVPDAFVRMQPSLSQEEALSVALLHALERYQGAQAKGDAEWALVQARAVRDLSAALDAHLADDTAVADLRSAVAGELDGFAGDLVDGADFVARVRQSGFTADERRALRNRGVTPAEITELENTWVAGGPLYAPDKDHLLAMFDGVLAADAGMRQALQDSVTGWDSVVTALEDRIDEVHPTADAGGPYTAPGGDVTLDASGSAVSPAAAVIRSYQWDLDGDGQYDDATGRTPAVHVDSSRTVTLHVTDDNGRSANAMARITVTGGDRAPEITAASPETAATVRAGTSGPFNVTAADPDGDALSYAWTLDGEPVAGAAGSALDFSPTSSDVGEHLLSVTAQGARLATVHTWSVSVLAADADGDGWTATPDCDDALAVVHPGGWERMGNGIDDDCDPASPDGPVGGTTGSVHSWGHPYGAGLPVRNPSDVPYYSPVPLTSLGSTVRQVESSDRDGFAVLADGTVRSWGLSFTGRLGDPSVTGDRRWEPGPVVGVGGAPGSTLNGVSSVSSDSDSVLALRDNGTVVAWGSNGNQQLGDGSTVSSRTSPVPVLTDAQQPLSGVAQVELGESSAYAVMNDGTVRTWGVDRCDGDPDVDHVTRRNVATTNARYGDGAVQIASGDGGGALVRKADGSLWSCGGYEHVLGRPWTIYTRDELHRVSGLDTGVVDVAMGASAAVALREDGSVWMWGKNVNHSLDVLGLGANGEQQTPARVALPAGAPVVDVETDYSDTTFARRADGSVLVWGTNAYGGAGIGTSATYVNGIAQLDLGGSVAVGAASSVWNGLALVRPADDPQLDVPAQYVSASVADTEVTEGQDGSATLTLSQRAPYDLTVTYTVGDGPEQSAPVGAGAVTAELPVSVPDDALDEDDEQLPLRVVSISHAVTVAGGAAVVTVHDDDAAPAVSVGEVRVDEGDTSLTDVAVPVTLSAPSGKDVQVSWSTADRTATAPDDYAAAHGVAMLPAGETSATVHLSLVGDTAVEPDETLLVSLSSPENATIGSGAGTITIRDDEPLALSVTDVAVEEGDTGTTPATFTLAAPALPAGERLVVPWTIVAGTADIGPDVRGGSGQLELTPSAPSDDVTADVVSDTVAEPLAEETFRLQLDRALMTSAGRRVVVTEGGVGTIADDDTAVAVDAGPDVSGVEGAPVPISGTATGPATWTVDDPRCTVADPAALSTIVTCVDDVEAVLTLTADGSDPVVSDTAALSVANQSPTVTITSPVEGTTVEVDAELTVTTMVSDPGDDPVACLVDWGDGSTSDGCAASHSYPSAGNRTVTVTATDDDGGRAATSVTVAVTAKTPAPRWTWRGFFAPVANLPAVNTVKAGQAIPVSFSLGGYRGMGIFAPGYPVSVAHSCGCHGNGGGPGDHGDHGHHGHRRDHREGGDDRDRTMVSIAGAGLSYSPGTDRYQFVWKTQKSWAGQCRTLIVTLADGTTHTAEFRFR
jgi:alpha-tubulin suppressor-like RCC1 family protein